jgi:hypothetical protein
MSIVMTSFVARPQDTAAAPKSDDERTIQHFRYAMVFLAYSY